MTKTILASLAVLALAASGASAATQHKTTHHRHAMKPAAATAPAPVMSATPGWTGGPTAADHELYVKNQHDAGLAGKR